MSKKELYLVSLIRDMLLGKYPEGTRLRGKLAIRYARQTDSSPHTITISRKDIHPSTIEAAVVLNATRAAWSSIHALAQPVAIERSDLLRFDLASGEHFGYRLTWGENDTAE